MIVYRKTLSKTEEEPVEVVVYDDKYGYWYFLASPSASLADRGPFTTILAAVNDAAAWYKRGDF